jgi:hypothetical protein
MAAGTDLARLPTGSRLAQPVAAEQPSGNKAGKYRSIFHSPIPPDHAFRAVRDEMRSWLRQKGYDLDAFDRGDSRVGNAAVLLRNSANAADGSQTERWRLRESSDGGAWISSLTVHAPAGDATTWFWIEIEFAARDQGTGPASSIRAGVPRLARGLLSAVPASDSLAGLTNEPAPVSRDGVDHLIDVLCDPNRRYPSVVASAHPTIGFEEWRLTISRVMRNLPGLASTYVLDPLGTQAFKQAIGRPHAVWGGALRTYMRDVDPAVADEALRHRVLSADRIAADPERAVGIVSALPRLMAAEAPLPSVLAGLNRRLLTQTHTVPGGPDAQSVRSQLADLGEERDIALNLAEEQEERANSLFTDREIALAELAERDQRVLYLQSQVRALQRRLVEVGRSGEAFLPAEELPAPPATFADLLDWVMSELPHIAFTGDPAIPLALDQRPESSTWVRSSWEALRAMQSYAEAKATGKFPGDFKSWCENSPAGAEIIPSARVVRDESESVHNKTKWRRERILPVPEEIDPSGQIFMGAHVRVGASAGGRISPRLHFHDATSQNGMIYVGYLGRHLTNTRT